LFITKSKTAITKEHAAAGTIKDQNGKKDTEPHFGKKICYQQGCEAIRWR
jgi:hypothetical protein